MNFEVVIDEIIKKVSPEVLKSIGTLSAEGYKKIWTFIKKKFAKDETVRQIESAPEVALKEDDYIGLCVLIEKRYREDVTFKNALDTVLYKQYPQSGRTVIQSGEKSVYIENTSGNINIS